MNDRRSEPLTDEALTREIEAALIVDPSPEFVARIRTRVGRELGAEWGSFPRIAMTAACAMVIAALIVVSQWPDGDVNHMAMRLPDPPVQSATEPEQAVSAPTSAIELPAPRVTSAHRVAVDAAPADVGPTGDVVISAEEAEALKDLFVRFSQRRIEVVPSTEVASRTSSVIDITIDPIVVEPLASGSE
jgi:hypothetical protein